MKLAVLPGDGIGVEVVDQALALLARLDNKYNLGIESEKALVGGCAYDAHGHPLPEATLKLAQDADAILLGAVGGTKWEGLDYSVRPERALLGLRGELNLYANLRPAIVYSALADASSIKREIIEGLDILVVRELTGGIYFGKPKGVETLPDGTERGFNTMVYTTPEIERIAKVAFEAARKRSNKVCSVDKANVLECTELWRRVVTRVHQEKYQDVELSHMYVDNCAMQLLRNPKQFDVIVTTNMFGDILSDEAAMLTGSIGMLPSASLCGSKGLYEPVHGSAPDIAGQDIANPIATILSAAMLLQYTPAAGENGQAAARDIENAVQRVLDEGYRTKDIHTKGMKLVGCAEMGRLLAERIE
ncbi:MAG: 3-isopropylmalate dehydrogenase [Nitrospinota bacterium]|nr:3-isopropylmalate dehydrogenase [Nitrospinota bacterium]